MSEWQPETYYDMGPGDQHNFYPGQTLAGIYPDLEAAEREAEAG